jgi:hypothetical protein
LADFLPPDARLAFGACARAPRDAAKRAMSAAAHRAVVRVRTRCDEEWIDPASGWV